MKPMRLLLSVLPILALAASCSNGEEAPLEGSEQGLCSAAEAGAATEGSAAEEDHAALELTLMGVSLTIAVVGIAIAGYIWLKRRSIADNAAREFPGVYRLLLNKYYVDELYDATIVQPIKAASTEGLWRWFDVRVIDGAVNGTATIVEGGAAVLRRLQSGSVRAYASSLLVGVVVILGYYLWR